MTTTTDHWIESIRVIDRQLTSLLSAMRDNGAIGRLACARARDPTPRIDMMVDEIAKMAYDAGLVGLSYQDFLHNDKIGDAYVEIDENAVFDPATTERIESAYARGRQVFRLSGGWVVIWTSAPVEYDSFDTEELECSEWGTKRLRKVLVDPANLVFQRSRYMSGAWVWDDDPRETERKIREKIAKEREEDEAKKRKREEGLSWLRSIDTSELDSMQTDTRFDELRTRGVDWRDARNEEDRRRNERESAERLVEWHRCRAAFTDGCTIVDPGRDAQRGKYGPIPGSDCAIYRNVCVVPHWDKDKADNPREACVEGAGNAYVGSLGQVVELLERGLLRVATADEHLPPTAVLDRFKPRRLDDLLPFECEGQFVWIGRERGSFTKILILDERGKLVRKTSIKEAANRAFAAKRGY